MTTLYNIVTLALIIRFALRVLFGLTKLSLLAVSTLCNLLANKKSNKTVKCKKDAEVIDLPKNAYSNKTA